MPRPVRPRLAALACAVILPILVAGAQPRSAPGRALTVEDYYRIQSVGSPVDGAGGPMGAVHGLDARRGR
ncbi:MAG: hypothetical protein M0C28_23290 [Candidatus Moduliflexus flocculans]|nr:hypothetical protein [Candidatus Moduliflexus flocculans]